MCGYAATAVCVEVLPANASQGKHQKEDFSNLQEMSFLQKLAWEFFWLYFEI